MFICQNAEGVHANRLKCWRGTCSSVWMLKGYMLICVNAEGVHAHLCECWRGTWQEKGWEPLSQTFSNFKFCLDKSGSLYRLTNGIILMW